MATEPTAEQIALAEEDDKKVGPWTSMHDELIMMMWLSGRKTLADIATRVGRTVRSVDTRLWKISSGYVPYTPNGLTDRSGLPFFYEDLAVVSTCVKPGAVSRDKHTPEWMALVLRRTTQEVDEELLRLAQQCPESQRKRLTTEERHDDRIKYVRAVLGNKYGFGKGLTKIGHHKKRSR